MVMGVHPREILGHSQISTTLNIYAHMLPRVQREAITGLDALFAETKLRNGEEVGQAEE